MIDSKIHIPDSKPVLTPGQKQILDYLEQTIEKTGQSPCLRPDNYTHLTPLCFFSGKSDVEL